MVDLSFKKENNFLEDNMKLNIEHIKSDSRFWTQINALAREAFPPGEYLAPEILAKMAEEDHFDFLALTENETFVGFMVVQTHKRLAYLFFLAIDPHFRSQGYGSRAIETLKGLYPEKKQVVDFEMIDETSANNQQRIKRKEFYLRNGYKETGLFLSYLGVDYEVMCMDADFCVDDFKELMQTIQVEGFSPRYFSR